MICPRSPAGGGARRRLPRGCVRLRRTTSDRQETSVNVFAIRHGETVWSLSGQHTGTTDIPLTDNGRRLAEQMRPVLAKQTFALVLVSPMQRARETCELAGLGDTAGIHADFIGGNYRGGEGGRPPAAPRRTPAGVCFLSGRARRHGPGAGGV